MGRGIGSMVGKRREIQVLFLNKHTVFYSVRWGGGLAQWLVNQERFRFDSLISKQYFTQLDGDWGGGLAQWLVNQERFRFDSLNMHTYFSNFLLS